MTYHDTRDPELNINIEIPLCISMISITALVWRQHWGWGALDGGFPMLHVKIPMSKISIFAFGRAFHQLLLDI